MGAALAAYNAREAERWRRIEAQYVADIVRALQRRLPLTAARIEAERNEWIAAQYQEGDGPDR
jgi:hypothetical protein